MTENPYDRGGLAIDPTFRAPGAYRVLFDGRECDAFFLPSKSEWTWAVVTPMGLNMRIGGDVTVLHRLVPESDDVVDAEVEEDWTILRKAADAILHSGYDPTTLTTVLDVADYLTGQAGRIEADHRAAQEKVAADVAREALIEKAADIIRAHEDDTSWDAARSLADAGLLAEAVQS